MYLKTNRKLSIKITNLIRRVKILENNLEKLFL